MSSLTTIFPSCSDRFLYFSGKYRSYQSWSSKLEKIAAEKPFWYDDLLKKKPTYCKVSNSEQEMGLK